MHETCSVCGERFLRDGLEPEKFCSAPCQQEGLRQRALASRLSSCDTAPVCPDSSAKERPVTNREAAGSSPAQGSIWFYVLVRTELGSQVVPAMVGHVGLQMGTKWAAVDHDADMRAMMESRIVVLRATKEQMFQLRDELQLQAPHVFDLFYTEFIETEGALANVMAASGLLLEEKERETLRTTTLLGALKPWSMK